MAFVLDSIGLYTMVAKQKQNKTHTQNPKTTSNLEHTVCTKINVRLEQCFKSNVLPTFNASGFHVVLSVPPPTFPLGLSLEPRTD